MKDFLKLCLKSALAKNFVERLLAVLCLLFLMLFPSPGGANDESGPDMIKTGPGVVTELWDGKVLTATFRAGMCFEPDGQTRGVLLLRHSNGNQDVYHLYGRISRGEFELSHGSGHVFKGRLISRDAMEGKVKLANGISLSLKGARHRDAPLLAKDCAPLPE